ncbi:MAG: c-type cytochrome, partial [Thermodesulfobacteriota bacterium]
VVLQSCKGNEEEESESEISKTNKEAIREEEDEAPPTINHELAEKGEELFKNKGCIACHTIGGGRLTGPDLTGVTERRELKWIENMILNPDQMLEKDPIARELLATYMVKMTNQNVKPEEAQAIIMYLREKDSEKEGGDEEGKEKSENRE